MEAVDFRYTLIALTISRQYKEFLVVKYRERLFAKRAASSDIRAIGTMATKKATLLPRLKGISLTEFKGWFLQGRENQMNVPGKAKVLQRGPGMSNKVFFTKCKAKSHSEDR